MSSTAFFARWRVRAGYPLAAVVLWLARPSPQSILAGAIIGAIGLWIRARAAGYLQKQQVLTVTGPYAYTRNPLAFQEYARAVPLFFPRLTPAKVSAESVGAFSLAQYKKNREYRAAIGFLLLLLVFIMIWRLRLP